MKYGNTLPKNPNKERKKYPFNGSVKSPDYINVKNRFIKEGMSPIL